MRYGLESYLPLGAFEHCGNRHIKLYGGGGSWNPVTIVSNAVSSVGDAVSSATQAVGKAASDVGNAAVTVAKQVGDVVVNDYKTVGGVVQNLAHGQIGGALKAAVGGFVGDVSILTGGKAQTNQTLGSPGASGGAGSQTIASGQAEQKPTSLNNQSVLGAPGVTGSLTTRTISGPDNTYKMDKTTMLGL